MKATLLLVTLFLAGSLAGAGIQAAQTDTAHKTVLVTGCLQKTDAEPGFALTSAETLSQTTPEQVSAPPGAVAANTAAGLAAYELRPASGIGENGVSAKELEQHVGTRVEITARPAEQRAPAPTSSSTVTTPQPQPPPKVQEPQPKIRLTVTAIKPLGSTCS